MNIIEVSQQKPSWVVYPVGWFTIVTLHASYFQTFKHLNQVH